MATIHLKNIDKTFFPNTNRAHHALKNISLTIQDGDFITIIGGNGAGKSTLLNAIAGAFTLDSGHILFDEMDVTKQVEFERAKYISRVFQDPLQGTAPRMTVAENMSLALRRGEKRGLKKGYTEQELTTFKELLSSLHLGLEERLNAEMGLLSGGQRQSIALLMATMKTPQLILLDEHTAALDPKTQRQVMKLTQEKIQEQQLTALMITHNLQDALQYGNRLLVLHRGEVAYDFAREEKEQLTLQQVYQLLVDLDNKE